MKLPLIATCALISSAMADPAAPVPNFTADWESLDSYRCPAWFRDAKFGIWSHWGPQSVPMAGDWYARHMYHQDHADYKHHLTHYGHPTTHGYKDIIPLWKAEKWDPDRLMTLYKNAGARYFVSMGVHHDNFDLWNSRHHPWNAVKMGPKRDIVGDWQKAAKKAGLRFGVSEHLGASYTWWAASKGSDKTGPHAGAAYDGADPAFASLYHPLPAPGEKAWYSTNPQWHAEWSRRIHDLVETYQPDLLYSDGGLPFGATGRQLLADFYNGNMKVNGGRLEAVYNCKSHHGNKDIRFTTKDGALYAIALGWPQDGKLLIRSLAGSTGVTSVSVLGSPAPATWRVTPEGLEVTLPATRVSPHTAAVRIEGTGLKPTAQP